MTRRLEAGPALVTLGALLALVALFMDWYEPGISAWRAFEVWDLALLGLALAGIAAGIGLMVPDVDVIDRRWLPAIVAAVVLIAASQIIDPPPAAAGQEPETGAWLALAAAVVMCVGGVLTFGRVHLSFTMDPRDPRRRVPAVDSRPPQQTTDNVPAVPAGEAKAAADGHEAVTRPAGTPVTRADDGTGAAGRADAPAASRGGRLFSRGPATEEQPAAVPADADPTKPLAPEGNEPQEPNKG